MLFIPSFTYTYVREGVITSLQRNEGTDGRMDTQGSAALREIPKGRATVHAVSSRITTAAARVESQGRSCGICGGQSGKCQFSFQRLLHSLAYHPRLEQ
jgi:hypothetical protein